MSDVPPVDDSDAFVEPITVSSQAGLVRAIVIPRTLEMYTVTNQELEALASGPQSVHIGFLGTSIGALLVVIVALLTVQMDRTTHGLFLVGMVLSVILTAYFGIRAVLDLRSAGNQLSTIRSNRRIG